MAALGVVATPPRPPVGGVAASENSGSEADAAAGTPRPPPPRKPARSRPPPPPPHSSPSAASNFALATVPSSHEAQVLDKPARCISEAILRGIERFPVGPERSAECARRRKDVRAYLPQLAQSLERIDEALRISGGTDLADLRYSNQKRLAKYVLDRYSGLRFALQILEAHDRLCRDSCKRLAEDDIAVEYSFLKNEIESRQAHAEGLLCRLEGSSFSISGTLVWTLRWLTSPLVYLGSSLVGCAYRPVTMLRDGCSDRA